MNNFIMFVSAVFGGAWDLFSLPVPGFTFSYADVILAVSFGGIALGLLKYAFTGGTVGNLASKGRSARNPKISKERMNDEK